MAWESRGGNRYYYRKVRLGRKVLSKYVGSAEIGAQAEAEDQQQCEKQAEDRQRKRIGLAKFRELRMVNQQIGEVEQFVQMIYESTLISAGFHQHKRQWRKRR